MEDLDIREAVKCLETSSYSRSELELYDRTNDAICTHITLFVDAEAKGMSRGIAEGLAEGEIKDKAEVVLKRLQKRLIYGSHSVYYKSVGQADTRNIEIIILMFRENI